jgi:innexin
LLNYVKVIKDDKKNDAENSSAINYVVTHMESFLNFRENYMHQNSFKNRISSFLPLTSGLYVVLSYLSVKILYAVMAFVQLILLNYWFRDSHYSEFGWPTLFGEYNWNLRERFPRMTLCHFQVYQLTDQQTHWIQCALPINLYIEKMYIMIWFWLWILFIVTVLSIFKYLFLLVARNKQFIANRREVDLGRSNYDEETSKLNAIEDKYIDEQFIRHLKPDGVLLLRLLKANTSSLYVNLIVSKLYDSFAKKTSNKSS